MAANDKAMSSRLLTMKFMQRGVANSPTASPSHQRSSKRQRTSTDRVSNSYTPRHSDADLAAMQAAIAEEEAKRLEVVERLAAEQGDTRWVLSVRAPSRNEDEGLRVSLAGFADIDGGSTGSDSDDEEEDELEQRSTATMVGNGRMKFGKFAAAQAEEGDKEDGEDDDDDYDPSDLDKLIADAATKQVAPPSYTNGRMPTSISGGGASRTSNTPKKDFICFKCGSAGHMARSCPAR